MNLAATLPRLGPIGFLAGLLTREARPQRASAAVLAPQQHTLSRHATFQLVNSRLELRVLRGCLWITRDGCLADVILRAGDAFDQRPGAPVLVHALEDAELLLVATGMATQNP